jgi:hypothetical protein
LTKDPDPAGVFLLIQSFLLLVYKLGINKIEACEGIKIINSIALNQENKIKSMTWSNHGLELLENVNK